MEISNTVHVFHARCVVFTESNDVGRTRGQAQRLRFTHDAEPVRWGAFLWRYIFSHVFNQHLCSTTGQSVHACFFEDREDFQRGHVADLGQTFNFNGAETVQVNAGMMCTEMSEQVRVPCHGQIRIHATLHENSRTSDGFEFPDSR